MATIENILEVGVPLELRSQVLLLYLKNVQLCKIRACVMPVSFRMVDKVKNIDLLYSNIWL